jgi:hypothetical protein
MMKGLKFAVVSAIFLLPLTYPRSALSWTSLTYQEAVWMCNMGYRQACNIMYAYEMARSGRPSRPMGESRRAPAARLEGRQARPPKHL